MTEIEVAKIIIEQNGDCCAPLNIDCDYCPAKRMYEEKGLGSCIYLWAVDTCRCKQWFENFLNENNGDKMKTEKVKELREKLKNITDEQLETIADIIYDKVVDPDQHIIDAYNEFHDRIDFTDEECSFAIKVNSCSKFPKTFYAGFKAAEKMYKK